MFNGECDNSIKQAFIESYSIPNDKLILVVETTSTYKMSRIYLAERDDTSSPIVIDWGDGTIEQINGNVSRKEHTYASVGMFNVVVENVKSYSAEINGSWSDVSDNHYTLKQIVAMPNGMTTIAAYAFQDCKFLTYVKIGKNVASIGNYAFDDCSGLTSMTIPDSVTSIGSSAFLRCSNLTSIVFKGKTLTEV